MKGENIQAEHWEEDKYNFASQQQKNIYYIIVPKILKIAELAKIIENISHLKELERAETSKSLY